LELGVEVEKSRLLSPPLRVATSWLMNKELDLV